MTQNLHVVSPTPHKTYTQQMLDALLAGEEFTGPEAYERWGVWSVSSLISGLRAKGWQVDSRREAGTGRAVYYIVRRRQLKDRQYFPSYQIGV